MILLKTCLMRTKKNFSNSVKSRIESEILQFEYTWFGFVCLL